MSDINGLVNVNTLELLKKCNVMNVMCPYLTSSKIIPNEMLKITFNFLLSVVKCKIVKFQMRKIYYKINFLNHFNKLKNI